MANAPATIIVTFPYTLDAEEATERTVELRAEVSFAGVHAEPTVVQLEKSNWEDALGPEIDHYRLTDAGRVPVRSEYWNGADDLAIDVAWDALQARIARAS